MAGPGDELLTGDRLAVRPGMKVAIMQPYFLPYVGYYQLAAAVDVFVVYDNIKYTKKGWFNRNRLLLNGSDALFSLPLRKASDALDVRDRFLASDFDREKLLNQFRGAYAGAPQFAATWPLIERVVRHPDQNLFGYIRHAIAETCAHLGIETPIRVSSTVPIEQGLRAQDKVIAVCKALGATTYVNPIGGVGLYSREDFEREGIDLRFLRPLPWEYPQFGAPFVPWLSILDVMMFNAVSDIRERLHTACEFA